MLLTSNIVLCAPPLLMTSVYSLSAASSSRLLNKKPNLCTERLAMRFPEYVAKSSTLNTYSAAMIALVDSVS